MRNQDNATLRSAVALPAGFGAAALGVLAFSFTLPATEFALRGLDPYLIGIGRAGIAAVLAAVALRLMRARRLRGRQWASLAVVALGIVFGFPVLSTLALAHGSSSSHAAVVVGLLPVATAVFAVVRAGERPSPVFWAASLAGAAFVVAFTLRNGVGRFSLADALLFGALVTCGLGYAEGGRLAREMPGPQVVSWALVLVAPITVPVTVVLFAETTAHWSGAVVAGLAYVSGVSMFLGFFAWYAGLAKAGVARASQVQLAQPLLTLLWSWLLLGEAAGVSTVAAAAGVLVCVLVAQRARVARAAAPARPAGASEAVPHGAAGKG
ncbi:DMT family transporter [Actinoallomurus spadix]|uniref:DMT family transporter n=1 Tax=Actinoallomurus spadix TaxID=79912 RepID=A0ABN0XJ04_9ACTN|nr:DMT family transporter [Actinoallomurus spadix]MCO5987585.1 DMT family transporter [Actinoallomurus spadix]